MTMMKKGMPYLTIVLGTCMFLFGSLGILGTAASLVRESMQPKSSNMLEYDPTFMEMARKKGLSPEAAAIFYERYKEEREQARAAGRYFAYATVLVVFVIGLLLLRYGIKSLRAARETSRPQVAEMK